MFITSAKLISQRFEIRDGPRFDRCLSDFYKLRMVPNEWLIGVFTERLRLQIFNFRC